MPTNLTTIKVTVQRAPDPKWRTLWKTPRRTLEDFMEDDSKDQPQTRTILRNKLNGRIYGEGRDDGCHANGNTTT